MERHQQRAIPCCSKTLGQTAVATAKQTLIQHSSDRDSAAFTAAKYAVPAKARQKLVDSSDKRKPTKVEIGYKEADGCGKKETMNEIMTRLREQKIAFIPSKKVISGTSKETSKKGISATSKEKSTKESSTGTASADQSVQSFFTDILQENSKDSHTTQSKDDGTNVMIGHLDDDHPEFITLATSFFSVRAALAGAPSVPPAVIQEVLRDCYAGKYGAQLWTSSWDGKVEGIKYGHIPPGHAVAFTAQYSRHGVHPFGDGPPSDAPAVPELAKLDYPHVQLDSNLNKGKKIFINCGRSKLDQTDADTICDLGLNEVMPSLSIQPINMTSNARADKGSKGKQRQTTIIEPDTTVIIQHNQMKVVGATRRRTGF